MFFSMYILKDRVTKIDNLLKNIKPETANIDNEKSKLYGFIYDMLLSLEELKYINKQDSDFVYDIKFLSRKINHVEEATDMEELLDIHEGILSRFKDYDFTAEYSRLSMEYDYRFYNYNGSSGTRTFSDEYRKQVINAINNNNRKFSIFDPYCKNGDVLADMHEVNSQLVTYGLESDNSDAETAKTKLDKVIKGVLTGSRIKNDAFDIVLCNCPLEENLKDNMNGGSIMKAERKYMNSLLKYVKPQGIIVISIPYFRMHKDVCTFLAKTLDEIQIVKGTGFNVNIIGRRSSEKLFDQEAYDAMRACYNFDNVPDTLDMKSYVLRGGYTEVELFKGSVLDMDELFNIVQNSGCMDQFYERQKVDKIHENTKRPLLPFNVGQIGLVLTSGCLDGIIDEGDGHYHLVKGRVSKKTDSDRDVSDGIVEETEIVSNRVEINVMLPNGEFKTLA